MLCDSLEEWDEGEVQEGRAIPVLRADVCYCIAGTNAILESNYLRLPRAPRGWWAGQVPLPVAKETGSLGPQAVS